MAQQTARWWSMRPARNRKPATYRCPFCGRRLLSATDHVLIAPEGDAARRRHAHLECVQAERAAGRLVTLEEWRSTQPRGRSLWQRLRRFRS
jgi:hypothetical protein